MRRSTACPLLCFKQVVEVSTDFWILQSEICFDTHLMLALSIKLCDHSRGTGNLGQVPAKLLSFGGICAEWFDTALHRNFYCADITPRSIFNPGPIDDEIEIFLM